MQSVDKYVRVGSYGVNGWLEPVSARIIAEIGRLQDETAIEGGCAEIGVHHGRLMILLMLLNSGRPAYAIDIFDLQHLNVDHSGAGNKRRFLQNVRRIVGDPDLRLIEGSSLDVTPGQIDHPIRIFSVDGGHTVECTLHDLKLAAATLSDGGIIILDDVFNEGWPEVVDGLAQFLASGPGIVPFALSPGKVYLCPPAWRDRYRVGLKARFPRLYDKSLRLFGTEVDIYGAHQRGYLRKAANRVRGALARLL